MENTLSHRIDEGLLKAMSASEWSKIPYEALLQHNPVQIREEESKLSAQEVAPEFPAELVVENLEIPSQEIGINIRIRVYRHKNGLPQPVLLYFHGGAFIFGNPEQYDFMLCGLAADASLTIVSVDYRLAPEHPFPAALNDGYQVLKWLAENAKSISGRKDQIIIGGSSAGATIAMSVAHLARDLGFPEICHQYLLYPPTDHRLQTASMAEFAHAPMHTRNSAYHMWRHYLGKHHDHPPKYAVPLQQSNFDQLPAATIVVCELDPLKDEAIAYSAKLREAGIDAHLIEIKGAVHAFDFFPCELSDTFYKQQVNLLKKIIKKQ
ncbi:alpha/beta hydrolase [Pedobacter caeni]|uniref:Acetyl esterase n=1 Tax=Pedobacter caeni TaxID=288992 RepID=A0A1M5BKZ1_9SPHI|nr:alpha/beta hydrolase [Pedobacter caeni]SHF42882.1 acetyl esterase [Pedobacter caeni]